MKNLINLDELSTNEIMEILNLADQLKFERQNGIRHTYLKGKTLGMILDNPSSRTRVSLEVGMYDLGGHAIILPLDSMSDGCGESISDSAAVLTRFVDCVAIRTAEHSDAVAFARGSGVPVINAMTDISNPCQALADLMTIREYMGSFEGRKLCFVGAGVMATTVIYAAVKMGMEVCVACPSALAPEAELAKWAQANGKYTCTQDIKLAAKGADIIYTDSWSARERCDYMVNDSVLAAANEKVIVLHCLPVHRDEEISTSVFSAHSKEIFDQAENRLHVQKAVLVKLLKK